MAEQRVALVTGVSSGIGLATATGLLAKGFRTFGTVRGTNRPDALPPRLELIRLDLRDEESVLAGVQAVFERAGRIDALINNAGSVLSGSLEETSIEEAKELFDTNFFGVLRMCQVVLPIMRLQEYGRIVNISSVLGFLPAPYMGIYAAAKHALEGYSESLDHEVRGFGIRVSLVEPGFTRTNLSRNGQPVSQPLTVYEAERRRAIAAIEKSIANGVEPATVASIVVAALTSNTPRVRYPGGREARLLTLLKKFAPQRILDRGLRKQFGLAAT
jgi:NAD(P)-dependent dehydrogenase (short-subunit alcohol dehydrogenase family)